MIKVENLNKYYNKNKSNEIHVISNTSIDLPSTGLITFLGSSGSGKTTLLNAIAGLDSYSSGKISYDDTSFTKYKMTKVDEYRSKNIGVIFQNYNLLQNETVYENLKIALEIAGVYDEDEVFKRIEHALKSVGLFKFRKKTISALSGGQQQRVAIARALLKHNKVIVADEPTGNLDSETSIEIMNILKGISKKALVLLVTHDRLLARAYSDRILEIKDGSVISDNENKELASVSSKKVNDIYLKDMSLKENDKVKIYHLSSIEDLEIRIVEHNNTFFIESNKSLKLLNDSSLNLIDDNYKEVKIDNKQSFSYDDSFYKDIEAKGEKLKAFKKMTKASLGSFFRRRRLSKFFHLCFIMLGMIIAIVNISMASNFNSEFKAYTDESLYKIPLHKNDTKTLEKMKDAYKEGLIERVYFSKTPFYSMEYIKNSFESYRGLFGLNPLIDAQLLKDNQMLYGKKPQRGEVALGKTLAESLSSTFKINEEELVGMSLSIDEFKSKISGITRKENTCVYTSELSKYIDINEIYLSKNDNSRYVISDSFDVVGFSEYEDYEIVYGSDIKDSANENEVIFPARTENYEEELKNLKVLYEKEEIIPVGLYKGNTKLKYISNKLITHKTDLRFENMHSYDEGYKYKIIEGSDLSKEKLKEAIVPAYSNYKVGDYLDEYKIVGTYVDNGTSMKSILLNDYSIEHLNTIKRFEEQGNTYQTLLFEISDLDKLNSFINDSNISFMSSYDYFKMIDEQDKTEARLTNLIIIVVLLSAEAIYITFTMRSKMINDIYEIGVLRSIGASKKRIVAKYAIDTIVVVTFTSILGYLLASLFYGYIAIKLNTIGASIPLIHNYYMTYLFIPIIYLLYLTFGLLPITTLLRKTPSEIIAKYDI